MFRTLLLVGTGGFLGSIARYLVAILMLRAFPTGFPFGTFVANIVGCFLIGLIYGCADRFAWFAPDLRLFLTVGFCGGFTTFSSFAFENVKLLETGSYLTFAIYTISSVALGIGATIAGVAIVKQ